MRRSQHGSVFALLVLVLLLAVARLSSSFGPEPDNKAAAAEDERSQITVKSLGGTSRRVDFAERDTVAELRRRVAALEGTPLDNLKLVYGGKQLEDNRLLSDYGIQRDSSVILVQSRAPPSNGGRANSSGQQPLDHLLVRTITGEVIEVPADWELTVGQLKVVIELIKPNVAAEKQQLIFNGLVLDDHRTLGECGLVEGATVTLSVSMASGRAPATIMKAVRMTDRVQRRIVASLVDQINQSELVPRFGFQHNGQFARLSIVQQLLQGRLLGLLPDDLEKAHFMGQVLKSEDLRAEFIYEHAGRRESVRANLREGAQWVADQAQAILAAEQFERDLARAKQQQKPPKATTTNTTTSAQEKRPSSPSS